MTDEFVPSLRGDFLRRDIDSEAVVWSPDRSAPWVLDPVATVMLAVIDGDASIAQLVGEVSDEVGVPWDVARAQVLRIVELFAAAGLLFTPWETGDRPVTEPPGLLDGPLSH